MAEDTLADVAKDTLADVAKETLADVAEDTLADVAKDTLADVAEDTLADVAEDISADTGAMVTYVCASGCRVHVCPCVRIIGSCTPLHQAARVMYVSASPSAA